MDDALARCKKKSVVLHLKGIGGIGKSLLLKHWINTKERTIRVDCEHYTEFMVDSMFSRKELYCMELICKDSMFFGK